MRKKLFSRAVHFRVAPLRLYCSLLWEIEFNLDYWVPLMGIVKLLLT